MALDADTVDEEVRRAVIAARLDDDDEWPEHPLLIPVVEATTGRRRVLDRSSGVDLVDAVAASSAVPGVWPPVTLGEERYIDGGVWSLTNSDLAGGHDRVLVLAPIVDGSIATELVALGTAVRNEVVSPDAGSLEAFGPDVLDPGVREPSARAGLAQGRAEADRIRALLTD
jgi:NTE family protein